MARKRSAKPRTKKAKPPLLRWEFELWTNFQEQIEQVQKTLDIHDVEVEWGISYYFEKHPGITNEWGRLRDVLFGWILWNRKDSHDPPPPEILLWQAGKGPYPGTRRPK